MSLERKWKNSHEYCRKDLYPHRYLASSGLSERWLLPRYQSKDVPGHQGPWMKVQKWQQVPLPSSATTMENMEEDRTKGTFVHPLSDQNNQIINTTLNYLPDRALTEIQVRNHNDSFKAFLSLFSPDLSSYFLLPPSLWPCFSSGSEDPSAFQQITIFCKKAACQYSALCKSPSPAPPLRLTVHPVQRRIRWSNEKCWRIGSRKCQCNFICFKAVVGSAKLFTLHPALYDHHIYLCNLHLHCPFPAFCHAHATVTETVAIVGQVLAFPISMCHGPALNLLPWHPWPSQSFPPEKQLLNSKTESYLIHFKPTVSCLTHYAQGEQTVPFCSGAALDMFEDSYTVPFPVFTWLNTQEMLSTPPMQSGPQVSPP